MVLPRSSLLLRAAGCALLGFLGCSSLALVTPVHAGDPKCLMSDMSLSNGLTVLGQFSEDKFYYECGCMDWTAVGYGAGSPDVTILTREIGSIAQVYFNGKGVNTLAQSNALNNDHRTSNPLATKSNQWRCGHNDIKIKVACTNNPDPTPCEYIYTIDCVNPTCTPPVIVGDPQFVGLRGQSFQVHGVAGEIYNIVSDVDVQYNSRFVFLDRGDCPIVDGVKQKGCFSHPGSYLGELGLKTKAGDRIHLQTGSADQGYAAVTVNGREVEVGDTVDLAGGMGFVTRNSTHLASVQVGNWDFAFENSDMFVNQRVRVLDARRLRSHGMLGQTWRTATYKNAVKHIQGAVDDYVIRDRDIFGDNFMYNVFN